jgi:hypothetical protein
MLGLKLAGVLDGVWEAEAALNRRFRACHADSVVMVIVRIEAVHFVIDVVALRFEAAEFAATLSDAMGPFCAKGVHTVVVGGPGRFTHSFRYG